MAGAVGCCKGGVGSGGAAIGGGGVGSGGAGSGSGGAWSGPPAAGGREGTVASIPSAWNNGHKEAQASKA